MSAERLAAGMVAVTVWLTEAEARAMAAWPDTEQRLAGAVLASVSLACADAFANEVDA